MTPCQLLRNAARALAQQGVPDPAVDASLLLSHVTHIPPLSLRLDMDTLLADEEIRRFESLLARRLTREPLQYILSTVLFMGHEFRVDPRVLIPRPETELLTEMAIQLLENHPGPRVLDLCTGSGCIGISIALACPGARVTLSDISEDALAAAKNNAAQLGAEVEFLQGDLFEHAQGPYDLIISNPPYIPASDCLNLQPEVLREPRLALDGGCDGLDFYRRIAREAPAHLSSGGWLLMEIGDGQSEAVLQLLTSNGFTDAHVYRDYQQLDRMVRARYVSPEGLC